MTEQPQRREDPRYSLTNALGAEMEFDGPDGRRHRYPLLDLSIRGAGFSMPLQFEGSDAGAMLGNAMIRVDELAAQGNLRVLHGTLRFPEYGCGVQFYPKSDVDQNQLTRIMSRLEARRNAGAYAIRSSPSM